MTDLKPWIDDGAPDDVRALLRAARAEEPGRGGPGRTLAALGIGSAALAATSHAAAGTAGTAAAMGAASAATAMPAAVTVGGVGFAVKWGLVGALGAVSMFGVVHAARVALAPASGAARAVAAPAVAPVTVTSRVALPALELPAPGPEPARAVVDAPSAPRGGDAPTTLSPGAASPVAAAPVPTLAPAARLRSAVETAESRRMLEEVSAVDRARTLLARGDTRGTIAALDSYVRLFPEQRFAPEAIYLRMEASARAGDRAGARTAAAQLVQAFPTAPQAARARAVLGSSR